MVLLRFESQLLILNFFWLQFDRSARQWVYLLDFIIISLLCESFTGQNLPQVISHALEKLYTILIDLPFEISYNWFSTSVLVQSCLLHFFDLLITDVNLPVEGIIRLRDFPVMSFYLDYKRLISDYELVPKFINEGVFE